MNSGEPTFSSLLTVPGSVLNQVAHRVVACLSIIVIIIATIASVATVLIVIVHLAAHPPS